MKLEFDPTDVGEVNAVTTMVSALHGAVTPPKNTAPAPLTEASIDTLQQAATERPLTEVSVATAAQPKPVDTPAEETPSAETTEPNADGVTDKHGMTHNSDYHSTPPKMNADGTWKMRRGKKAELEAAIAAHKVGQTQVAAETMTGQVVDNTPAATEEPVDPLAPQPSTMPKPSGGNGMPSPNTPQPPIDYEALGQRFMGMIDSGIVQDFENVYRLLGVNYDTFETDQRALAAVKQYMDYRDQGHEDDAAIKGALQAHPIPV